MSETVVGVIGLEAMLVLIGVGAWAFVRADLDNRPRLFALSAAAFVLSAFGLIVAIQPYRFANVL